MHPARERQATLADGVTTGHAASGRALMALDDEIRTVLAAFIAGGRSLAEAKRLALRACYVLIRDTHVRSPAQSHDAPRLPDGQVGASLYHDYCEPEDDHETTGKEVADRETRET